MVKNSPLRALFSYFINDFPGIRTWSASRPTISIWRASS